VAEIEMVEVFGGISVGAVVKRGPVCEGRAFSDDALSERGDAFERLVLAEAQRSEAVVVVDRLFLRAWIG
jgi:hypothetical protein